MNWLVLRDLDRRECAPELLRRMRGNHVNPRVCVRIPVRALESWFMADHEGLSREFSIQPGRIPLRPDELEHPKRRSVRIFETSRQREVRRAMTPGQGSERAAGPERALRIENFARATRDPEAAANSPSLARALGRTRRLVADGVWS